MLTEIVKKFNAIQFSSNHWNILQILQFNYSIKYTTHILLFCIYIIYTRISFFFFNTISFIVNEVNNAAVFLSETTLHEFRIRRKMRAFGNRIRDIKALHALYAIYNDGSAILCREYICDRDKFYGKYNTEI